MIRSVRATIVAGAAAAVLAAGAIAGGVGSNSTATAAASAPSAVDIGFSQDMIVHHEQAVLMAKLVRDRTVDPKIAALSAGIEGDQLLDIGALRGYLALWGAPVLPSGPPMTWMAAKGHHGDAAMPGMASTAELDELRRASGEAADRVFLTLMIRHHEGGMAMLVDAGTRGAVPVVRSLANRIAYHQREESQTIAALLANQ